MSIGARVAAGSFSRFLASLLFAVCLLFIATGVSSAEKPLSIVDKPLNIVFEVEPERDYPELEFECLKAVTVDAFVGNSGHVFHFPAVLTLTYEQDQIAPNSIALLTFTFAPYDGEGSEYDLERGLKFNIDGTYYDWGFKYGNDVEGDFVPPMRFQPEISLDDMLATIWEKGMWCFGSAVVGLYTVEGFDGNEVRIPLYIETPNDPDLVYFLETGTDSIVLSFTSNTTTQCSIKISQLYAQDIIIAQVPDENPVYIIDQTESLIQPGFEINAVNPKWSWLPNPCRQKRYFQLYFPWFDGESTTKSIPISDEGQAIIWNLSNGSARSNLAGYQDLAIRSHRLSSARPKMGSSETIVSIIRNLYGEIGNEYEWIRLDYYIHGASAADEIISIGTQTITSDSPELARFNSGDADEIRVEFVYDDKNSNYIFTADHKWDPYEPLPRYVVQMTSELMDSGKKREDWLCVPDSPSLPGSNVYKVPFQTLMPDFAIDSLYVDCPPHLQFRDPPDTAFFTFKVTNRGSDYYAIATSVPFTCTLLFQRMISEGVWNNEASLEVYNNTVPAINSGASWIDSFECTIPYAYSALPVDRALFLFEVNPDTLASGVNESAYDYENNFMYTYVNLADYPDSAYASPELYIDGSDIEPGLPGINATPPCTDSVFLYIADASFDSNGLPPESLLVQIGVGDFETSPRDSSWSWTYCFFIKDFYDDDFQLWKVYVGSPCALELIEDKDYSYCFRATINHLKVPVNPAYIYVDSDGASSAAQRFCTTCTDNKDNSYLYDNAGFAKIAPLGSMLWAAGDAGLFQDNFPVDPENLESTVRADMAADIIPKYDASLDPGDSIVVGCRPMDIGEIAEDGSGPRIYMHVKCTWIGPGTELPLYGPSLEGTYGTYDSDDGMEWTVIQGDTAYSLIDGQARHLYMFDLNDSLFTRGYMIEYYFSAHDTFDNRGVYPHDAESGDFLEFTCLPTLASDILYVDDYSGIGTRDGIVQLYFDQAFRAVLPPDNQPDRYDVNAAGSSVSNGLGSRAYPEQLIEAYNTIIWDSGDLPGGTICDAVPYGDKSMDCEVVSEWIMNSDHNVNLWILGDNVAEDMNDISTDCATSLLEFICGTILYEDSYFEMTGGCDGISVVGEPNVLVKGVAGSPLEPDTFYLLGGCYEPDSCPPISSFDVLVPSSYGSEVLDYPDITYYAGISRTGTNPLMATYKTMWFGFSFMQMRAYKADSPAFQFQLMNDVFTFFGIPTNGDYTGAETPRVNRLAQNYPNPFNPTTRIRFSISERSFVNLKIYNVAGQLVKTLVYDVREAGTYIVAWDGKNNGDRKVASGIYFCRFAGGDYVQTKKMVLLR